MKTSQAAIKHLEKLNPEKPFFLWVHYIDPHAPYYLPPRISLCSTTRTMKESTRPISAKNREGWEDMPILRI